MILIGECKIEFKKWYIQNDGEFLIGYPNGKGKDNYSEDFYDLPLSYQYGVLVDFFESTNIRISINTQGYSSIFFDFNIKAGLDVEFSDRFKTRQEAREAAIEKANQIFNREFDKPVNL